MNPQLCKLSHFELVTPDVDKSYWFFCDLVGMHEVERDGERVYLRCPGELDHHSLVLREGPPSIDHTAFRVMAPDHVEAFATRLNEAGTEVERVPGGGSERGHGDAIRFTVPHVEVKVELFYDVERPLSDPAIRSKLPSNSARYSGCAPRRIDHVNYSTSREGVEPGERWFLEQLGFKRREFIRGGDGRVTASWMSVTSQVHDLALTIDRENRPGRLNHISFFMEDFADVTRLADILAEHDIHVDVPPGRHGVTQGRYYYLRDPGSGHRVEFFSGGYQIYDPDWEPIEWTEEGFSKYGLKFVGWPGWTRENNPNSETTPC